MVHLNNLSWIGDKTKILRFRPPIDTWSDNGLSQVLIIKDGIMSKRYWIFLTIHKRNYLVLAIGYYKENG